MKTKRLLSIVLAAVLMLGLLTACGTPSPAESQPQPTLVRYDHPIGISMTMVEGFEPADAEGFLGGYKNRDLFISIAMAEELYESMANVGLDPELTLEEYGQFILDAYGIEGTVGPDALGNPRIRYEKEVQGQPISYFGYLYRNDVAFWTVTFMCKRADADALEADIAAWAATVQIPAEAVTEPYIP